MPRFEPFAGVRYAPGAGPPDDLIAPPYDVISPADRAALVARSPHNAVLLELPDSHERAAELWTAWRADGTLIDDDGPTLTVVRMTAAVDDRMRTTTGVLGALVLEDPGHGILPHEQTTSKDKADRLGMLRTVRANLSPIWALSPTAGLAKLCDPGDEPAYWRAVDEDGVVHEVWVVDDAEEQHAIADAVAAHPVLIADGHHRFEVANAYRAEAGAAPGAAAILALVVELADDELVVDPIHRLLTSVPGDLVERLVPWFEVTPAEPADEEPVAAGGLLLVTSAGRWLLRPRPEVDAAADGLDTSLLRVALDGTGAEVRYQHGTDRCLAALASGDAEAVVLVRPATIDQIAATGRGGKLMPPKTTFFWPKPRTGLAFRSLD